MTRLRILLCAMTALALLALPAVASAKGRDSDRDGMPNRWERAHHLKVHRNDARRDADHDGLTNLAEYRDHTNPNDADTDNDGMDDGAEVETDHNPLDRDSDDDGVKDGNETTGTVQSFDGKTLVIELPDHSTVSGAVDGSTEIRCEGGAAPAPTATAASDPGGDDHGDGEQGDAQADDQQGEDQQGDDHEGDSRQAGCDTTALTTGAVVHEAEVEVSGGAATFKEVQLVR